jgi:hypothetical protein
VSADVKTRWCEISVESREIICEDKWARKDEVDALCECNVKELLGDGADFHWKSGVSAL